MEDLDIISNLNVKKDSMTLLSKFRMNVFYTKSLSDLETLQKDLYKTLIEETEKRSIARDLSTIYKSME
jgi:hypothetical protein